MSKEQQTDAQEDNNEPKDEDVDDLQEKWLIRDCYDYKDEYNECTSFRGRFHQYFIYGETIDCNQWKKDYTNCCKWTESKDIKAAKAIIHSENERRMIRLKGHYGNDIWKRRKAPPEDWNKPLPEWMVKRDEGTYLAAKSKELKEGKPIEDVTTYNKCCIM